MSRNIKYVRTMSLLLLIAVGWMACKDDKPVSEKEEVVRELTHSGSTSVVSDSVHAIYMDSATFRKVQNKVMFNLAIDSKGSITLQGWNPPLLKTDSLGGPAPVTFKMADTVPVVLTRPLVLGSLFMKDKKGVDKVLKDSAAKFVVFVPVIKNGQLTYKIMAAVNEPSVTTTATPMRLITTDATLNPSPPYSDQ